MRNWITMICWMISVYCGSTILYRIHPPLTKTETLQQPVEAPAATIEPDIEQGQLLALGKGKFHSEGEKELRYTFTEQQIEEILVRNLKDYVSDIEVEIEEPDQVGVKVTVLNPKRLPELFPLLKPASEILQWLPECRMNATARLWGHENEILIDLKEVDISGLPVPQALLQSTNKVLNKNLKGILDKMEGLDIQVWQMEQGELKLEGTGPEKLIYDKTEKPDSEK